MYVQYGLQVRSPEWYKQRDSTCRVKRPPPAYNVATWRFVTGTLHRKLETLRIEKKVCYTVYTNINNMKNLNKHDILWSWHISQKIREIEVF